MKDWFLALSERERYLLLLGGGVLLALLLWLVVWRPWMAYKLSLQNELIGLADDYTYLQQAKNEVDSLRNVEQAQVERSNDNVEILAVQLLQKYNLDDKDVFVRSEARARDNASLRLEGAQFDQLVQFMGELETRYGIYVTGMVLTPADQAGLTGANLTLER